MPVSFKIAICDIKLGFFTASRTGRNLRPDTCRLRSQIVTLKISIIQLEVPNWNFKFEPIASCDRFTNLFLPLHLRGDFQSQGVEPDEAGGVVLVVGLGRVGFHRGVHFLFK